MTIFPISIGRNNHLKHAKDFKFWRWCFSLDKAHLLTFYSNCPHITLGYYFVQIQLLPVLVLGKKYLLG